MAAPLKDSFGPSIVDRIAEALKNAWSDFEVAGFRADALQGYEDLELTERARSIAGAMATYLPAEPHRALEIVIGSLGPELENVDPADAAPTGDAEVDENPMSGFFYLPHNYLLAEVADRDHASGGADFDLVMEANYQVTKRFTSEFGIRTPLRNDPDRALAHLRRWAGDPNVHVRRLVSEGTRPRLPWSFQLKHFRSDPTPVIELLDALKDDPVEYVRRSVANNLNDIAKDHPELVVEVANRWWEDGDDNRRRLVRHGLRTLVKQGDPDALAVLGFSAESPVECAVASIEPPQVEIGAKVVITVELTNPSTRAAGALVDLKVHFVKANGSTSAKVFKGAELELAPGESRSIRKSVSLRQHTTRTHYPGEHRVEVLVNGIERPIGTFVVTDPTQ